MTRHPLSSTMTRAAAAGDALRALVTREAVEPDLSDQEALNLTVALDAVSRAVAPLKRSGDEAIRRNAGRLAAALVDEDEAAAVGSSA